MVFVLAIETLAKTPYLMEHQENYQIHLGTRSQLD